MMDVTTEHDLIWSLSPFIGYDHLLFDYNSKTIVATWIFLAIIVAAVICVRILMHRSTMVRFVVLQSTRTLIDMVEQGIGSFSFNHTAFIGSMFIFILGANVLSLIPGLEEPTTDLNTTLALGLISFLYTQAVALYTDGPLAYLKSYFTPFAIMFPLNVVGKLSTIISISFRLFGNIFSGAMISSIYFSIIKGSFIYQALGLVTGINIIIILFFTLFEGFLQALVFTMLTLTYLGIAINGEGH